MRVKKDSSLYGRIAVLTGFVFLFLLLADIISKGTPAFTQSFIKVSLTLDPEQLDIQANPTADDLRKADYSAVIKQGLRECFLMSKAVSKKNSCIA